jgi:hypothetical protein
MKYSSAASYGREMLVTWMLLIALLTSSDALADSPISIARGKSGKVEAIWKGSHRPGPNDILPTDEDVAALASHPEIQVLNFDGQMGGTSGLTGRGLNALVELPLLEEIRINGINVGSMRTPQGAIPFGPEGFAAMAKMKKLRVLWIQHAHIPVSDLAILLRSSPSLEELTAGSVFCDELIEAAAVSPKLRLFKLGHWENLPKDAPLTFAGYQKLADCKKLESLDTGIHHPTGIPWQQLLSVFAKIENLKKLNLQCADDPAKRKKSDHGPLAITAEDLEVLSELPQLKELGLMNGKLATGALAALANYPSLETIQLRVMSFDEMEARALLAANPKLKILVTEGQPIRTRKL